MAELDHGLGEMADTIRDTTRRFAREKIEPITQKVAADVGAELWNEVQQELAKVRSK